MKVNFMMTLLISVVMAGGYEPISTELWNQVVDTDTPWLPKREYCQKDKL